jgi:hypothetical protein
LEAYIEVIKKNPSELIAKARDNIKSGDHFGIINLVLFLSYSINPKLA